MTCESVEVFLRGRGGAATTRRPKPEIPPRFRRGRACSFCKRARSFRSSSSDRDRRSTVGAAGLGGARSVGRGNSSNASPPGAAPGSTARASAKASPPGKCPPRSPKCEPLDVGRSEENSNGSRSADASDGAAETGRSERALVVGRDGGPDDSAAVVGRASVARRDGTVSTTGSAGRPREFVVALRPPGGVAPRVGEGVRVEFLDWRSRRYLRERSVEVCL